MAAMVATMVVILIGHLHRHPPWPWLQAQVTPEAQRAAESLAATFHLPSQIRASEAPLHVVVAQVMNCLSPWLLTAARGAMATEVDLARVAAAVTAPAALARVVVAAMAPPRTAKATAVGVVETEPVTVVAAAVVGTRHYPWKALEAVATEVMATEAKATGMRQHPWSTRAHE